MNSTSLQNPILSCINHFESQKGGKSHESHLESGVYRRPVLLTVMLLSLPQLLLPLITAYRYEGAEVNMTLAKSEAKILHAKIAGKAYNHEELIRILTTRSKAQLNATFNHYNSEFGNPINKVRVLLHVLLYENLYCGCLWLKTMTLEAGHLLLNINLECDHVHTKIAVGLDIMAEQ